MKLETRYGAGTGTVTCQSRNRKRKIVLVPQRCRSVPPPATDLFARMVDGKVFGKDPVQLPASVSLAACVHALDHVTVGLVALQQKQDNPRTSVYPGSQIMIFIHPGSRIQKVQQKRGRKKICCHTFLVATLKIFLFLNR